MNSRLNLQSLLSSANVSTIITKKSKSDIIYSKYRLLISSSDSIYGPN